MLASSLAATDRPLVRAAYSPHHTKGLGYALSPRHPSPTTPHAGKGVRERAACMYCTRHATEAGTTHVDSIMGTGAGGKRGRVARRLCVTLKDVGRKMKRNRRGACAGEMRIWKSFSGSRTRSERNGRQQQQAQRLRAGLLRSLSSRQSSRRETHAPAWRRLLADAGCDDDDDDDGGDSTVKSGCWRASVVVVIEKKL